MAAHQIVRRPCMCDFERAMDLHYTWCRKITVSRREDSCEARDILLCRGAGRGFRRIPRLGWEAGFQRCMDSGREGPETSGNGEYAALEAGDYTADPAPDRRRKSRPAFPYSQPLSAARHAELDVDHAQSVRTSGDPSRITMLGEVDGNRMR